MERRTAQNVRLRSGVILTAAPKSCEGERRRGEVSQTRVIGFEDINTLKAGDKTAAALGFFDGVHVGHAAVIGAAARQGMQTAVVTFAHSPGKLRGAKPVPEITCRALKEKIMASLSVDIILELDYEKVKNLAPEEFIDMLSGVFNLSYISSGFNYRFGKGASAGTKELEAICAPRKIEVCKVAPVCIGGKPVSSTRIRKLIEAGDMKNAAVLLGRPFAFYAEIIHGHHLGRTLGTPTINQRPQPWHVLPKFGVYASISHVDGKLWPSVTNVGIKPTISDDEAAGAETYIPGFEGDLYGRMIQVDLIEFVRPERRFDSIDELKAQMRRDTDSACRIINAK